MEAGPNGISMFRGDSHAVTITVKAENAAGKLVVVDLTGATATLSVKKKLSDSEYLLQVEGVIDNGPLGQASFELAPSDTEEVETGKWTYDVQVTLANDKVYTVLLDRFELKPEVTRPAVGP